MKVTLIKPKENHKISKLDIHEHQPYIFIGVFSKEKEKEILEQKLPLKHSTQV